MLLKPKLVPLATAAACRFAFRLASKGFPRPDSTRYLTFSPIVLVLLSYYTTACSVICFGITFGYRYTAEMNMDELRLIFASFFLARIVIDLSGL